MVLGRICTTLAAKNLKELEGQIKTAFSLGSDFIEIRFDFLEPHVFGDALKIIKGMGSERKAIFTLRSKNQGGQFEGSESERIALLKMLSEHDPMLIDIELDALKNDDSLADHVESQRNPAIVSWHDFKQTPASDKLADILSEMRSYSNYVKVVSTAITVQDALRILGLYENADGLNLVAFAMGQAGTLSRILCTLVGNAPFTYATLDKPVAPGQISVRDMRRIYDKIDNRLSNSNS